MREMVGSGLGACELLATIRRDNPRTFVVVTPKRIQEVKLGRSGGFESCSTTVDLMFWPVGGVRGI